MFFKVLVELAQLQDEEVGDGTTSVVIIAAELLKNADDLVKQKIHPTSIIAGYRLACKEACKYIQENLTYSVESLGEECLINAAKVNQFMVVIQLWGNPLVHIGFKKPHPLFKNSKNIVYLYYRLPCQVS